jgi:hypothetical protein
MGIRDFFDMDDAKSDIKRLLAFILVIAGILVGILALIFDRLDTEVIAFASALIAGGIGILGKIAYDVVQSKKDDIA